MGKCTSFCEACNGDDRYPHVDNRHCTDCGHEYPCACPPKPRTREEICADFKVFRSEKPDSFKLDAGKPRIGLVLREVPHALEQLGVVLGFGAEKYSVGNWKNLEDIEGRFLDAMMRHLTSYHKGEKVDPESGKSHLAHVFFNAAILLEKEMLDEVQNQK